MAGSGFVPAPSNPMRCSDRLLAEVARIAERHDTPVHMHLLETAIQATIAQQKRYGWSMVQHLDRLGLLTDRLSTAHTIWLDDDDIALFAERGAIPVHNPESNLKLGTGISPIAKMLHAGVTVALGTDGASTNDNLDMHEVMRLAADAAAAGRAGSQPLADGHRRAPHGDGVRRQGDALCGARHA